MTLQRFFNKNTPNWLTKPKRGNRGKEIDFKSYPALLTIEQVGEIFNIHANTVRNWDRTGKLKAVRMGSRRDRRYPKEMVQKIYLEMHPKETEDKKESNEKTALPAPEVSKYIIQPGFSFNKIRLLLISKRFTVFVYSVIMVAVAFVTVQVSFFAYVYTIRAEEKPPEEYTLTINPTVVKGWQNPDKAKEIETKTNSPISDFTEKNAAIFHNKPVVSPTEAPAVPIKAEEVLPAANTNHETITDTNVNINTAVPPPSPEPPPANSNLNQAVTPANTNVNVNTNTNSNSNANANTNSESVNTNSENTNTNLNSNSNANTGVESDLNANTNTSVPVEGQPQVKVLGEETSQVGEVIETAQENIFEASGYAFPDTVPELAKLKSVKIIYSLAADTYPDNEDVITLSYSLDNGDSWQTADSFALLDNVSNSTHGGYWEVSLNNIDIKDFAKIRARVSYNAVPSDKDAKAYLDGIILEAVVKNPEPAVVEIQNSVEIEKTDVKIDEQPVVSVAVEQESFFSFIGAASQTREVKDIELVDPSGEAIKEVNYDLQEVQEGKTIKAEYAIQTDNFDKPGRYQVKMQIEQDGVTEEVTQEFNWGVLAINPDQSIYQAGQPAMLSIGVLDETGNMVCDADVTLEITNPDGEVTIKKTSDGGITVSQYCTYKGEFKGPDYYTDYIPSVPGTYKMKLSATHHSGTNVINDSFEAQLFPEYTIKRTGPTRVFPYIYQPMVLEVTAQKDFEGEITEVVPDVFEVKDTDDAQMRRFTSGTVIYKEIVWQRALAAGQTMKLSYNFKTPEKSPALYFVGPARVGDWNEGREWQMAIDVTYMYVLAKNASAPSGWTDDTATFDNKYLRGAATFSSTGGGAATHAPTIHHNNVNPSTDAAGTTCTRRCGAVATLAHTHTSSNPTIGDASNDPAYHTFYVWKNNTGVPANIPQNAFGFFDANPGGSWTRLSAADSRLVKLDNSHTTGGTDTHSHTVTWQSLAAASGSSSSLDPLLGDGTAASVHGHFAPAFGSTDSQTSVPQYVTTLIYEQTNATPPAIPTGYIGLFDADPGAGWTVISDGALEDYYQRFIRGDATTEGTKAGANTTDHAEVTSGASDAPDTNALGSVGTVYSGPNHTHTITTGFNTEDHTPSYVDFVVAQYTGASSTINLSGVAYQENESSPINGSSVNKTVNLLVNGAATACGGAACTDEITTSDGAWAITGITAVSGDIITVFLNDETEEGTTVFKSDGVTQTNINIFQNAVIVRNDTGTSITNANLESGDRDAGDNDIKFDVSSSNVTVDSGFELHVWTGDTYDPGGTVSTNATGGDVHVDDSATIYFDTATSQVGLGTIVDASATLNLDAATTFGGDVTINSTGTWNNTTANLSLTIPGSLQNNGTFNAGTGTYTFNGATKTFSGTTATTIPSVSVSGTLQNNGTLTVSSALAGGGTLTNGATGALHIDVAAASLTLTTLTASASGNTVDYGYAGAQTVKAVTYHHLSFSGSGAKTLTSLTTVNGDLTWSGTATGTSASSLIVGGNLVINDTANFSAGAVNLTVMGTTSITGTLTFNSSTGTKILTGAVTINANGTWTNSGNSALWFKGGLTNNSANTFTAGSGAYAFYTNDQAIGGTNAISIPNVNVPTITLTNNGTLTVTTQLTGSGGITNSATGALHIDAASFSLTTLTASASGNTVDYGYAGVQTVHDNTYHHLTLSGSGDKTMTTNTRTIGGNLTLSGTATATTNASGTTTVTGDVIINTGTTLTVAVAFVVNGGDITGDGTLTYTGTPIIYLNGTGNLGGATAWTFYSLNLAASGGTATTTAIGAGQITIASTLTLVYYYNAGNDTESFHHLNAGPKTWTLSGSGTPFIKNATFTPATSTFIYSGTGSTNITGATYNNLTLQPSSGTPTYTLADSTAYTIGGNLVMSSTANLTVSAGTSIITMTGTSNTITGGGQTIYDLTINPATAGTITLQTSGLTLTRNLIVSSGDIFSVGAIALTVTGTSTITGTINITSATGTKIFTGLVTVSTTTGVWNNSGNSAVTFRGGITNNNTFTAGSGVHTFDTNSQALTGTFSIPSVTVTSPTTLTNDGTLTISTALSGTGGLTNSATGTLNIGGTSGITTITASASGNTVNYTGGVQTVHINTYHHLTLSGSGAKTMTSVQTVNGNLTLSGTVTATISSSFGVGLDVIINTGTTLTVAAQLIVSGGDITGDGTMTYTGTPTVYLIGTGSFGGANAWSFYNLTFAISSGAATTTTATGAGQITVASVLALSYWFNGDSDVNHYLDAGSKTWTLSGSGTPFPYNRAYAQLIPNASTFIYSGTSATNVRYAPYNNLTLSGAATYTQLTGGCTVSGALNVANGATFSIPTSMTVTNSGTFTLNTSGTVSGAGTVKFTSTSAGPGTGGTLSAVVQYDSSGGSIASTTFDARTYVGAVDIYGNNSSNSVTAASGTYTFSGNLSITQDGTGTTTLDLNTSDPTVGVTGTTTIDASTILSASSASAMSLGDDFTNNGTFTHNSGSVALTTTATATITGNTTFNNLSVSGIGAAKTITFTASSVTTVVGTWTVTGTAGNLITLQSSSSPTQWTINPTVASVSYVQVSDSNNTGVAFCATYSTDTGDNNTNWSVSSGGVCTTINVSGTIYTDEGSTVYNCSSNNLTVRIKVNGVGSYSADCTAAGGTFAVSNVSVGAINDVVTVFLDNETPNAVTITKTADTTSNLTDINLYQNKAIVRHESASAITNANLDQYDFANEGSDGDIGFTVTTNNITVASGWELHVWTGKTYNPGGTVATNATGGDLHVDDSGVFTTGGTTTVGANLAIDTGATMTAGAYDLTVTGTTGITGTMTISSATGTKILTGSVTVNSGGTWTNSGNSNVEFQGGLTNNSANTFTAGTGGYAFDTNSQAIGGTNAISIPSVTVTGVTLTNNGTLTVTTALAGSGGITNATTGALHIDVAAASFTLTTLTASASGNTVDYGYAGAQTVKATTYHHLILSTSGAKTMTNVTTINGNLTMTGTVTASTSTSGQTTVAGDVSIGTGTTLTVDTANLVVNGGDITGDGTLTYNGTPTVSLDGNGSFGGNTAWSFWNLTFADAACATLYSNATGSGGITVNNVMTTASQPGACIEVDEVSNAHDLYAGSKTWTIAGSGTSYVKNRGVLTPETSTFIYSGTGSTTVALGPYNNLTLQPSTGTPTYTLQNSTYSIGGNLVIVPDITAGTSTVNMTGTSNTITGGGRSIYNLTINPATAGTITLQTSGLTVAHNLIVSSGDIFSVGAVDLTVTGTSTITGTLTLSSATGTKIFTGLVTVSTTTGTWNNSGNSAITFQGGLTNNNVFTAGTGVYTFDTNDQAIGGTSTIAIPSVTVTTITLTNNGTLTVTTALAGTGGITNDTTGSLHIDVAAASLTLTTLTATASGNTVDYGYAGAQTVHDNSYHHLTLSGSGDKTMPAGTKNIGGNLTLSGTATATTYSGVGTTSVTGDVSIGTGTTLTIAKDILVSGGDITGDGNLTYINTPIVYLSGAGNFGGATNWSFYDLIFSISSSPNTTTTAIGAGQITVASVLTISSWNDGFGETYYHNLDAGSKTWTLSGSGTPFTGNATLTPSASTFVYSGTSATTVDAGPYYNLSLQPASPPDYVIYTIGDTTVGGNLVMSTLAQKLITQVGTSTVTMTGTSNTITSGGQSLYNLTINPSSAGTITVQTDDFQVDGALDIADNDTFSIPTGRTVTSIGAITLNTSGTVSGAGTLSLDYRSTGLGTGGTVSCIVRFDTTSASIGAGTFDARTYGGLVQLYNNQQTLDRVITAPATGTFVFSGGLTMRVNNQYGELTADFDDTTDPTVTVTGSVTIPAGGTFLAPSSTTLSVGASFSNSGTFTHNSGTVALTTSAAATITGNTTFNNLSVTGIGAAKAITFTGSSVTTVAGTWTVTGTAGNLITLQSSDTNNWTINPAAASVSYASISRSTNTGISFCAIYSTNGGNNAGWNISIGPICESVSITGIIYTDEGSTLYNCASNNLTIAVKVNGYGTYSSTCTTADGEYVLSDVMVDGTNDVLTVFLNNETPNAVAVSKIADTPAGINNLNLYQDKVIVRHESSSAMTNANLDKYDFVNEGSDGDIGFTVTTNNITVASGWELHVWTGDTYDPGGTVTTNATGGDLHVDDSAVVYLDTATNAIGRDILVDGSATLNIDADTTVSGGDITISGSGATVTKSTGTPTVTITGTGSIGGGTTPSISFYSLTVGTATAASTTAANNISVTNTLNVDTSDSLAIASGMTVTHSGATLTLNGTISGAGRLTYKSSTAFPTGGTISSILRFDSSSNNQDLSSRTYGGNVEIYGNNASNIVTAASGTYTISGSLTTSQDGTGATALDLNANAPNLTVNGALTVGANTILSSTANILDVKGNLTNNGTFSNNGGTVRLSGTSQQTMSGSWNGAQLADLTVTNNSGSDPDTSPSVIFSSSVSLNGTFTAATGGTKLRFNTGITFWAYGLTLTGSAGNLVYLRSSTSGTEVTFEYGGLAQSVTYADVKDMDNGGGTVINATGTGNVNSGNNTNWDFGSIRVAGTIYSNDGVTPYNCSSDNLTIKVSTNGGAVNSGTCTAANGTFVMTNITKPGAIDQPIALLIDSGETPQATSVTLAASTLGDANMDLYQNRLIIDSETGTTMTDILLDTADNSGDAGIRYAIASGNLSVSSGLGLWVWTGKNFTPGGTVTTPASGTAAGGAGDVNIAASATLNMAANALSVGGDFTNSGTFTITSGQATTFTATGTDFAIDDGTATFQNIIFNGSGGGWSFSSAVTLSGDLTMTAGMLSGTSDITVNGNDITGNGTINLTGGTVSLPDTGSLGGDAAWTFYNLSLTQASFTDKTTTAIGSGSITVSNVLRGYSAYDAGSDHDYFHILAAGSKTWILSGTGTPFANGGLLVGDTSTFRYTGNGATNIASAEDATTNYYYNLELKPSGTATYTLPDAIVSTPQRVNGNLIIGNGTNSVTVDGTTNNPYYNIGGNVTCTTGAGTNTVQTGTATWAIAGDFDLSNCDVFTATAGNTITLSGTSKTYTHNNLAGNPYNLNITGTIAESTPGTNYIDNNLTISGTFTSTAATLGVGNTFTNNGTFNANNGDVVFSGSSGIIAGSSTTTFFGLFVQPTGSGTVTVNGSNPTVTDDLSVATGDTLSISSGQILSHTGGTIDLLGIMSGDGLLRITNGSSGPGTTGTLNVDVRYENGISETTLDARTYGGDVEFYIDSEALMSASSRMASGTYNFNGNLYINAVNNANISLEGNFNNPTVNVTGNIDFLGSGPGMEIIQTGTGTWTVGGNIDFTDGTYTATTGNTLTMNGADATINTGGNSLYNFSTSGTGIITTASAITVTNDVSIGTGSTLRANTDTSVAGDLTGDGTLTYTSGTPTVTMSNTGNIGGATAWTFYNLTLSADASSDYTTTAAGIGNINIDNVLTTESADCGVDCFRYHYLNGGLKTWTLTGSGTPFINNGSLTPASSTFVFSGTSATTVAGATYNNLLLLPPSGTPTYTLAGSQYIAGDFSMAAGLTMDAGAYTVTMAGTNNSIISNGQTLYNLTIDPATTGTITVQTGNLTVSNNLRIEAGDTLAIDNGVTLAHTGNDLIILDSASTIAGPGRLTYRSATAFPTDGTLSAGLILRLDTTSTNQTMSSRTDYQLVEIDNSGATGGRTVTIGSGTAQTVTTSGALSVLSSGSGSVELAGATYNPAVNIGGDLSYTAGGGTKTITTGTGTWTVSGNVNLTNGTFTKSTGHTLVMNGSSKTLTSAAQILENLTLSGTITLANATHTVNGSLTLSGTVTAGSSNVTMTGTSNTIVGGGNILSTLTINPSSTGTITLQTSDLTVSGTLSVAADDTLSIDTSRTVTAVDTLVINGTISGAGRLTFKGYTFPGTGTVSSIVRMDATDAGSGQNIGARTFGGLVEIYNNSASSNRIVSLQSGTFNFSGDVNLTAANNQNVTLDGSGNDSTVNITGNLDFTGAGSGSEIIASGTGTWTISGNIDFTDGTYTATADNILKMNGTAKAITSASNALSKFEVSGGSVSTADALLVNKTLNISGGGFTQAANANLTVYGNFTIAIGTTFTNASGTGILILDGNPTANTFTDNSSPKQNMGDVQIGLSPGTTDLASDMIAKKLTINDGDIFNTNGYDLNIGIGGIIVAADGGSGGGTLDVDDDVETDGTVMETDGIFDLKSGGDLLNSGGTNVGSLLKFTMPAALADVTSDLITAGTGSLYDLEVDDGAGDYNLIVEVEDPLDVDNNINITGGILDTKTGESNAITIGGSWANSDTFTARSGTVTFDATSGTKTVNPGTSPFYVLTFNGVGGTWQPTTNTVTVSSNLNVTNGTVDNETNDQILDIGGNVAISSGGVLQASSTASFTVAGNWANSGDFTDGTGTVTLDGTAQQTLSGQLTGANDRFYNLTVTNAGAADPDVIFDASADTDNNFTAATAGTQLQFKAGSTYAFDNIALDGQAAGTRVFLRSSSLGTQWNINVSGSRSVSNTNVRDSYACGQPPDIDASDGTNFDATNNNCWFINSLTFSISDVAIGFGPLGAGGARWATGDGNGTGAQPAVGSGAHELTISSNSDNGYAITYYGTTLTGEHGTISNATIAGDGNGIPGTEQFALSASASGDAVIPVDYRYSSNNYGFVENSLTTLVSESGPTASETIDLYYIANIATQTEAGEYSTAIIYIATATF
ncbi:MAG: helix-turn-helix domain-containing protein [Patescibacteria group bacterium]